MGLYIMGTLVPDSFYLLQSYLILSIFLHRSIFMKNYYALTKGR